MEKLANTRSKTVQITNLLECLKELKSIGTNIPTTQILIKHKLPQKYTVVLFKNGILSKTGSGRTTYVEWATIPPNVVMAERLIDEVRKYTKQVNSKYIKRKKEGTVTKKKRRAKVVEHKVVTPPKTIWTKIKNIFSFNTKDL